MFWNKLYLFSHLVSWEWQVPSPFPQHSPRCEFPDPPELLWLAESTQWELWFAVSPKVEALWLAEPPEPELWLAESAQWELWFTVFSKVEALWLAESPEPELWLAVVCCWPVVFFWHSLCEKSVALKAEDSPTFVSSTHY